MALQSENESSLHSNKKIKHNEKKDKDRKNISLIRALLLSVFGCAETAKRPQIVKH